MSWEGVVSIVFLCAFVGFLKWRSDNKLAQMKAEHERVIAEYLQQKPAPCPPPAPITPGYPARWIEVNGFRYVLEKKEQSK